MKRQTGRKLRKQETDQQMKKHFPKHVILDSGKLLLIDIFINTSKVEQTHVFIYLTYISISVIGYLYMLFSKILNRKTTVKQHKILHLIF